MKVIPEIFSSKNTVFHYTKMQTAIEFILFDGKLRLSPRKYSFDPIENTKPWFSYSTYGYPDTLKADQKTADIIKDFVIEKLENVKQLCFCMNDQTDEYTNRTILPYEYYGFIKPRMWDQYADRYKGVCLAFSLDKLKKITDFEHDLVEYENYNILEFNHNSIDLNRLHDIGTELYCEEYFKNVERTLFRKHKDYIGENEYRFISYSKENPLLIDIKESLVGIVVSENQISDFSLKQIEEYAERYSVELIYIKWHESGINISTKKEKDGLINYIEQEMESLNNQKV